MVHDIPDEWVGVLFHRAMWPNHPLGRDAGGTEETVLSMTPDDLLAFRARSYLPSRLVVSIAGAVEHDNVCSIVSEHLRNWDAAGALEYVPAEALSMGPHVNSEARDTQQTHLLVGVRGIPRRSDDRYAVSLLSTILGQGMSSRLPLEIRERLGLAYSVGCYSQQLTDTGAVMVSAGVAPESDAKAIRAILGELRRIQDDPVNDAELSRAKEYTKGRFVLHMEDSFANASWIGQQEVLDGRILTVDQVLRELDAITAGDIQRVAQQLFRTENLVLAMVGPSADTDRLRGLLEL